MPGLLLRSANGAPWTFTAPRLDRPATLFALNNLVALLLALFVAFALDLARPFWAMLSVFIVVRPFSGAVRSRVLYRLGGTLLGAGFAVFVTPPLSPSPALLSLALAAWLGGCLFVSLLDRSPRSYVFMLAGYTATIVAFSNANAPGAIWDTALSRVEEISVGIICAGIAHSVLWPREVTAVLNARVAQVLGEAGRGLADLLTGEGGAGVPAAIPARLAPAITALQELAHFVDYDTARIRPSRRRMHALLDRLAATPPLAAGLADRLGVLKAAGGADQPFGQLAADVAAWLRAGEAAPEAAAELCARAEALASELQAGRPTWRALIQANAAARLADLVRTVKESRELAHLLRTRGEPLPRQSNIAGRRSRPLHRDYGLAALSGAVSAAALLTTCAVWISTAWPEGGAAATMVAVGCSLFAALEDPTPAVKTLALYITLSIPLAAVYQFMILPRIDGYVMLGLVLAPTVLACSYYMVKPSTALKALSLVLGFASGLALQSHYVADFAVFLNNMSAAVLGLIFALIAQRIARVINAEWNGRRLVRRSWRQVAALARAREPADRAEWLSRALDRFGLIAQRLPPSGGDAGRIGAADAFRDLLVGLCIIDLQQLRHQAPPAVRQQLQDLLRGLAQAFDRRRAGQTAEGSLALLPAIDQTLAAWIAEAHGEPRRIGLTALVGLRRGLFPSSPAYQGEAA